MTEAGRELDALIAEKVMGLNVLGDAIAIYCEGWFIENEPTPKDRREDVQPVYLRECECALVESLPTFDPAYETKTLGHYSTCLEVVPFYSTDIAAAWKIIDKMRSQGWAFAVFDGAQTFFDCHFYKEIKGQPDFHAIADTASEVICLAALKAIDGKS